MIMKKNTTRVKRGAILKALSGETAGEFYLLTRTMSGRDQDFLGNPLGEMRYAYNLVNLTGKDGAGKARQTEVDRQLTSTLDGISIGLLLSDLEKHYGIAFEDVTNLMSIRVDTKEILNAKVEEKHDKELASLVKDFIGMVTGRVVPLFDKDGSTVLAYVTV